MTLADLKIKVASYVNRAPTSFVNSGVDNLLEAINDARRKAMLRYDFNYLRCDGFVSVPEAGVDWTSSTTSTPGGTSVVLKGVREVWTYTTVGSRYYRKDRLTIIGETGEEGFPTPVVRIVGKKLYVEGATAYPALVMLRGCQWLADLTDASVSDFFLEQGVTWLTYQSVQNLNLYLKEDSRASIADGVVQRAWEDLTAFDGALSVNNDSVRLD